MLMYERTSIDRKKEGFFLLDAAFCVLRLVREERAGCFTFLCSECHVAVIVFTLPRRAMGWYVITAFPGHTHFLK